ncbi:MAG: hypothetical protein Q7S33_05925 [Nanoarchaeota archaeon]|nr:hypothetical protein [Nanoarchaeota archaeon]
MISNKRADIAIVLIVFLTLFLTITALFIFSTNSNNLKLSIADSSALNSVHAKKLQVNYYIQQMVDSSAKATQYKTDVKTAFIIELKNEIEKYQEADKSNADSLFLEFNQLKEQINENNINLTDESISINFNIALNDEVKIKNSKPMLISYSYVKTFVSNF